MVQAARSAQSLVFSKILYAYLWQLSCRVFDEISKDKLVVVPDQDDLSDARYFGDSS